MRHAIFAVCAALSIALTLAGLAAAEPAQAQANICANRTFEEQRFVVCAVDLTQHDIRLFLKQTDGTNYAHPEALPRERLLFATNAGMFTPEHEPAGLYVENGWVRKSINTRSGVGNFHVQPNGVFWVRDGMAAVSTTDAYVKEKPDPDYATQSGPMLVIGGKLNAKFDKDGVSRYIRNGVGVQDATHVYFAISEDPLSFGVFARLFKDGLKCPDALYLDGSISRLYRPDKPDMRGLPFGPMIAVYAHE